MDCVSMTASNQAPLDPGEKRTISRCLRGGESPGVVGMTPGTGGSDGGSTHGDSMIP